MYLLICSIAVNPRITIFVNWWRVAFFSGHVRFLYGQSVTTIETFVTAATNIERAPSKPEGTCVATKIPFVSNSGKFVLAIPFDS